MKINKQVEFESEEIKAHRDASLIAAAVSVLGQLAPDEEWDIEEKYYGTITVTAQKRKTHTVGVEDKTEVF